MTKAEIIEYLYENNVKGDVTIEQMAEDLSDRKTENSSEKPNNCETQSEDDKYWLSLLQDVVDGKMSAATANQAWYEYINHKDEPQTETETVRETIHKMIDNTTFAEDAYPGIRQRLHDAVDEYEPQTDCPWK